jgi:hypothetical protein
LRPSLALPQSGAPPTLLSLIQRCWDPYPEKRPSFEDIIGELNIAQKPLVSNASVPSFPVSKSQNGTKEVHRYQEASNCFNQGELFVKRSCRSDLKNLWSGCFDQSSEYHPTLNWGSFATSGRRETIEDTHFVPPFMSEEKEVFSFGIFYGHRGSLAEKHSLVDLC